MQFIQTQASVPAPQAPKIKSKSTQDPEVFTGVEPFIKQIYESLKTFEISLNLKMTLNLDCMTTLEAWIDYIFSRTSGTAQGYIATKSRPSTKMIKQLFFKSSKTLFKTLI